MIELLLAAERMLSAGDVDHAERLFAQVAEADPRNAIAVVGLAEVAAARGDDAGATAHARRALAIDPENAAARRMIDRLGEATTPPAVEVAPEPGAEPEFVAELGAESVSAPELEHEAESIPGPEPGTEPARRSWLDRLIGFLRRR